MKLRSVWNTRKFKLYTCGLWKHLMKSLMSESIFEICARDDQLFISLGLLKWGASKNSMKFTLSWKTRIPYSSFYVCTSWIMFSKSRKESLKFSPEYFILLKRWILNNYEFLAKIERIGHWYNKFVTYLIDRT